MCDGALGVWDSRAVTPWRDGGLRPRSADGLIASGVAYGRAVEGFVLEGAGGAPDRLSKVFDPDAGLFRVDAASYRRLTDAARRPGRLTAIHTALVDPAAEEEAPPMGLRSLDVLWTGRVPGVREAAVVLRSDPHLLGLGLVNDADAPVTRAASVDLGSRLAPLGTRRRELDEESYVGAAYVGDRDGPASLVAAATSKVTRIDFLVGTRRFSRPGPLAIVPVESGEPTTDVVVFGRTAGGEVIAPLVPASP